jgi:hypothetical protein
MPPKEKPQPTESQVALLHWWISNQADFKKKVKELNQPDKIKPLLLALQAPVIKKEAVDIPGIAVEKADDRILKQLAQKEISVLPVSQNNNYLMASFPEDTLVRKEDLELLIKLRKQLAWLKITNTNFEKGAAGLLSQLTKLTRLNVSNTNLTDEEISKLQSLDSLRYLNLVGTKATIKGVLPLQKLKGLHSLFLYETNITRDNFKELKRLFAKTKIDSGNYFVPLLATDTTVVKEKKK